MVTAIAAIMANELILGTIGLLTRLIVVAFLGGIAAVAGAGYSGLLRRSVDRYRRRKWRRRIRRLGRLVSALYELNERANVQLVGASSRTGTFSWVFGNEIRQRLSTAREISQSNAMAVSNVEGLWMAWMNLADRWPSVHDEVQRILLGKGQRDSDEFLAASRLLRPELSSFFNFTATVARAVRQMRLDWTNDQLDGWEAFKDDANAILILARQTYRDIGLELEQSQQEFWAQRVISIQHRGDPDEGGTAPNGPTPNESGTTARRSNA